MDAKAQYELLLIKRELQGIIDELSDISNGVKKDFSGIGNVQCANKISQVAQHYRSVKKKLDNMDTSAVSEEFAAAQGAKA